MNYKHTLGNTHRNENEDDLYGHHEQTHGLGHVPLEAGDGEDDPEDNEKDCNIVPGDPNRRHADAENLNGWNEDVCSNG